MKSIYKFLQLEVASGIILLAMALLAIVFANSPVSFYYQHGFHASIPLGFVSWPLEKWINDGLMVIFFLLVGLELKREFLEGELSQWGKIILPAAAAFGGMVMPALIYLGVNYPYPTMSGWPIPVATDIAFALGVLSLFGNRVPLGLKLFLMALAIFDDLGAILIIAFYYVSSLNYFFLSLAFLSIIGLWSLRYFSIEKLFPYLFLGFLLWLCLLNSGIHPTLGGVILAFMIPLKNLRVLENSLHPWVAFGIMPLFAFANAGVTFSGLSLDILWDRVTLGIVLGLFAGKQFGVFSFVFLMVKSGWMRLPKSTSWLEMYGVAVICGIGFTMSLFLGNLAFHGDDLVYLTKMRLAVLLGSTLSGGLGAAVLYAAFWKKRRAQI